MNSRSLSEIAYDTYCIPGEELPADVITDALMEAGHDPNDQRERLRFQRIVNASQPHQVQDAIDRCEFSEDARRICSSNARADKIILRSSSKTCHARRMKTCNRR